MKIFTVEQVRELDAYTIKEEPISSIDLMERASRTFAKWFSALFSDRKRKVFVFCGPGNNGGDGLAISRLLAQDHYDVTAYLLRISDSLSDDALTNYERLKKERVCRIEEIRDGNGMPVLHDGSILIDAIFGSGLSRPVEGYWARLIEHLNQQPVTTVSVDMPSGMFADRPTEGVSILADHTFSFELPKLGFLFPENQDRVGRWVTESIGLHPAFIEQQDTPWFYTGTDLASSLLRQRNKFDHKGTFGHALLVMGSYGKVGAAVLSARAAMRAGTGLVTVHAPACAYEILQTTVPEAMASMDVNEKHITHIVEDLSNYDAIGVGCGIGTNDQTVSALEGLLKSDDLPLVLDADALNLIAKNEHFLSLIPGKSILTPHPKEFERLFGATENSFERNELHRRKAKELGIYIILKGAHTAVACPDGSCYFNSTGNPGMATGGSGDVLTGILTGLLAQGYPPFETCLLGVYLHGLAGDQAARELPPESIIAGDIVDHISGAYLQLRSCNEHDEYKQ